jgi:hypothetical protein
MFKQALPFRSGNSQLPDPALRDPELVEKRQDLNPARFALQYVQIMIL